MIGYAAAAAHFARAGKHFKKAMNHAERASKAAQNAAISAAAIQSGQLAEQLTEDDLLNWKGPLPDGMDGSETL